MLPLFAVSLLWAFSFGLIKVGLGDLDPIAVATVRLTLAWLVFLPLLRPRRIPPATTGRLLGIGAVQFGLMYVLYTTSFQYLQAHEVALFTIFTPIYVVGIESLLARHWHGRAAAAAVLALIGAAALRWNTGIDAVALTGFLLVQGANVCFAAGQVAYRRLRQQPSEHSNTSGFAWLFLGGTLAAAAVSLFWTDWTAFAPTPEQWAALVYLGVIASGLGFFGWNVGATQVRVSTLAVFNNLVIPLAVLVALLFFGESADLPRLAISGALMLAALYLAERSVKSR